MFGVLAMCLWVGYVVSTRHFRRDMDVATFMATVSPIAALAVLPLAIAHGNVFGLSGRGWFYTLVLTLLIGVAGHGLMVFAQKTIQIGTIGIAQVAQPALAVVWSFLLLGERINQLQTLGIAVVMSCLLAFLVLNQRGGRTRGTEVLEERSAHERPAERTGCPPTLRILRYDGLSRRRRSGILSDPSGVRPVELGDEVGGSLHAQISRRTEVTGGRDVAR